MENGVTNTAEVKSDCEVCKQLMREKHRHDLAWKIACLLFALIATVFVILYFASGKNQTTSEVNLSGATVDTDGNGNVIVIGGDSAGISGTITETDKTSIFCITVIAAVIVLTIGGIIIALSQKNNS